MGGKEIFVCFLLFSTLTVGLSAPVTAPKETVPEEILINNPTNSVKIANIMSSDQSVLPDAAVPPPFPPPPQVYPIPLTKVENPKPDFIKDKIVPSLVYFLSKAIVTIPYNSYVKDLYTGGDPILKGLRGTVEETLNSIDMEYPQPLREQFEGKKS